MTASVGASYARKWRPAWPPGAIEGRVGNTGRMTPEALARDRGMSGKVLRGWLRRQFPRRMWT